MTDAPIDYDAELAGYNPLLYAAWAVQPHEHVLDIGCGSGSTTRAAARLARDGSALGVDPSAPAIRRARELSTNLPNVTFEEADAQTYAFPPASFDLAISRFGTMFFDDPVAAFTNIRRALRRTGRLAMLVWQAPERNEWNVAIHRALGAPAVTDGLDPFSLADPATVRETLDAAGFRGIHLADLHAPLDYGPDPTAALAFIRRFTCTTEILTRLDPAAGAAALARLTETLTAHHTADGVRFDSRAWLVTAEQD